MAERIRRLRLPSVGRAHSIATHLADVGRPKDEARPQTKRASFQNPIGRGPITQRNRTTGRPLSSSLLFPGSSSIDGRGYPRARPIRLE